MKISMAKNKTQTTGHTGVFYVCYKLSCQGWNVLPTSRNAKGVDIFVYSQGGEHSFGIEVKTRNSETTSKQVEVRNPNDIPAKFWIIVHNSREKPDVYILKSEEIKRLVRRYKRQDGKESYHVLPSDYTQEKFKEKWERLGNPYSEGEASESHK